MSSAPFFTDAKIPVSGSVYTDTTWGLEGSMVTMVSHPSAASSLGVAAEEAPWATALSTADWATSKTTTSCLALSRLWAMCPPMFPSPMNPTFDDMDLVEEVAVAKALVKVRRDALKYILLL